MAPFLAFVTVGFGAPLIDGVVGRAVEQVGAKALRPGYLLNLTQPLLPLGSV